ncbi:dTDP-4-dehydrorhamnose reductase [Longispora fulva]|uniref:dTDP-4-dehydrorhamnose reductase n=1 Tax=Longispora fulva TaxID=619741 RepID=A0A8J7KKX7_9ACTN|nr:sugar nucleotide-binding protein [Longispora fulva]MBG6141795.1 dTDP-4-dehydrorhamnose reductase [Longispora fulva]GIG59050.1 dTDP-4-dehydrorhamnose reductase [Longispora fulva]
MDTLLITGASGFLGAEVARRAVAAGWRVVGTYQSRVPEIGGVTWHRLDVTDRVAVAALVEDADPSAVVHTAFARNSWSVNADGAANVALASVGRRLVHVSSDAVFAGRTAPYTEQDTPEPITSYGGSKAAAETAIHAVHPDAVIVRNSLILGDGDSAHEKIIRDLAEGRRDGVLFTEELRCPIHVADLASALLELAGNDHAGVLNVAGPDAVSRYELGVLFAARLGIDPDRLRGGPAPFACPGEIRLDTSLALDLLHTRLRGVRELAA